MFVKLVAVSAVECGPWASSSARPANSVPVDKASGDANMTFTQNCSAKCLDGYDGNASLAVVYRCIPRADNRSKGGWYPEGGRALQCDKSAPGPAGGTTWMGTTWMLVIAGLTLAVIGLVALLKACKAKMSSKDGTQLGDTRGDGVELLVDKSSG